jgi:acyl dehydratase
MPRNVDEHRQGSVSAMAESAQIALDKEGAEIAALRVTPDKYLTARYAGASGDFNPIHIDEEFARAVGLPGRILHGLWTMAQVARAQTEAAGGPEHLKRLSVQFRGMGMPEQEIVVTGTVREVVDGRVVIDTVAEQEGKQIIRNAEAELEL